MAMNNSVPSSLNSAVVQYIRRIRIEQSLTQEYCASQLGVSRHTYTDMECGRRHITFAEFEKISAVLGTSLHALVLEIPPPEKEMK